MDVAVEDFNGDGAVYTGTHSAPGYNITDPTATVPTPSTGKFLSAFGSGNVVFGTGSSLNAPSGTNPTESTIALNGLLNTVGERQLLLAQSDSVRKILKC
jgi:hypothetical protein